jgi:site-specific DNA-methyltransferase (adenine-specific)
LFYEKPGGKRTFNLQSRFSTAETHDLGGSSNYRDREDVWVINREYKPGQQKNKNELPSALLLKMIQYSSNQGDLVCDFFMGGCSTAAVAIGMNRRFTGFEASQSTFRSRVPTVSEVRPGEMLEFVTTPTEHVVENRGKSWEEDERLRALDRFASLRKSGTSKKDAIAMLCDEFGRGHWSVTKLIKRYGIDTKSSRSQTIAVPEQPRLITI